MSLVNHVLLPESLNYYGKLASSCENRLALAISAVYMINLSTDNHRGANETKGKFHDLINSYSPLSMC